MRRFFLLCLVLTLAGCILDRPLSDPSDSPIDEELLGNWARLELQGGAFHEQLFVGKHTTKGNPKGLMEAAFLAYDLKNKQFASGYPGHGCEKFCFSTTVLGNSKFINIYRTGQFGDKPADLSYEGTYDSWLKDPQKRCSVLMYTISENKLTITLPDEELLLALQKNGTIQKIGNQDLISSTNLAAYLKDHGTEKIFPREKSIVFGKKEIVR